MNVLIVDDEPLELLNLDSILSSHDPNAIVRSAGNGMQAISLMEQEVSDIVYLDIQMPGWNGIETLARIKKRWPDVQVALVSAYGEFQYAKLAMELGVSGYILKPVVPDELIKLHEKMVRELAAKRNVKPILLQSAVEQWLGTKTTGERMSEAIWKEAIPFTPNVVIVVKVEEPHQNVPDKIEWRKQLSIALPDMIAVPQPIEGYSVYVTELAGDRQVHKTCEALAYIKLQWNKAYPEILFSCGVGERVDTPWSLRRSFYTAINAAQNKEEAIVSKCLAYLSKQYANPLTLNDLAVEVHISPSHLSRILKKRLGLTFVDLLTKIRIDKAKEMLDNPSISIEYISHCVGFTSPNYFAVTFRKLQGQSPRDYRVTSGV